MEEVLAHPRLAQDRLAALAPPLPRTPRQLQRHDGAVRRPRGGGLQDAPGAGRFRRAGRVRRAVLLAPLAHARAGVRRRSAHLPLHIPQRPRRAALLARAHRGGGAPAAHCNDTVHRGPDAGLDLLGVSQRPEAGQPVRGGRVQRVRRRGGLPVHRRVRAAGAALLALRLRLPPAMLRRQEEAAAAAADGRGRVLVRGGGVLRGRGREDGAHAHAAICAHAARTPPSVTARLDQNARASAVLRTLFNFFKGGYGTLSWTRRRARG
mmetsp:Transcript_19883/g.50271  ORF Transcript_19883/g.50271 Transcript_19883/m.50271 type:complete len:265 (+) Transcript_19883:680-1474(+)